MLRRSWSDVRSARVHKILSLWFLIGFDFCDMLGNCSLLHFKYLRWEYNCCIKLIFSLPFSQAEEVSSGAEWKNWVCQPGKEISSGSYYFLFLLFMWSFVSWNTNFFLRTISKIQHTSLMLCLLNGGNFAWKTWKSKLPVLILRTK